jgi:hypothetical protein
MYEIYINRSLCCISRRAYSSPGILLLSIPVPQYTVAKIKEKIRVEIKNLNHM